jgi:hypothetical protein
MMRAAQWWAHCCQQAWAQHPAVTTAQLEPCSYKTFVALLFLCHHVQHNVVYHPQSALQRQVQRCMWLCVKASH